MTIQKICLQWPLLNGILLLFSIEEKKKALTKFLQVTLNDPTVF